MTEKEWIGIVTLPPQLAGIENPPTELWARTTNPHATEALLESERMVAIVGGRACSRYASDVARSLASDLVQEGFVIVSGLARGVDTAAHRGALNAGGKTIGVLGCGIDTIYPVANTDLASLMVQEGGAVLSEYGMGVPPAPWRFPKRNRIVSGLCQAVIVVEARDRSGSLITADCAFEQGRIVMAVPGDIGQSANAGSNRLLEQGARVCLDVQSVLEAVERGRSRKAPQHQGI